MDVSRDVAGLRKAAAEFFLEGYDYVEAAKILEQTSAENQAAARKALMSQRSLPDGYYGWIAYLIWIERVLEITPIQLYAVELEGLLLLKQERVRFQSNHPPCNHCGMPNEVHAFRCRECMGEIGR